MSDDLATAFRAAFGAEPDTLVRAPGRVNLIGEHTDYNDGFVLPCAIDFETRIVLRRRADARVRVLACDWGGAIDEFALDAPIAHSPAGWPNYVRGVLSQLHPTHGADLAISGNVPQGAGLSSSAALEVAVARAFDAASSPTRIAQVAQRAENEFVGVRCGIMDQLVSAAGVEGHALLIDCRSLAFTPVPVPPGTTVMIVHSHVPRGLVDSAYNERRAQCEAAARFFGVPALRDVTPVQVAERPDGLDEQSYRRARHIVTENVRTEAAAAALAAGNLQAMGQLMAASHDSMRDDFQITVPAIDRLVAILQQAIGPQGGARMTGGGFGGCVVALMPDGAADAVQAAVERDYRSPEGRQGTVYRCRPSAGVARWELSRT